MHGRLRPARTLTSRRRRERGGKAPRQHGRHHCKARHPGLAGRRGVLQRAPVRRRPLSQFAQGLENSFPAPSVTKSLSDNAGRRETGAKSRVFRQYRELFTLFSANPIRAPAHWKKPPYSPWTSKAGRHLKKPRQAQYRVTGLVGMRAVVLLGLLAGATAFSGPSPVGEKLPPVPCARSERARPRALRRLGVRRKKARIILCYKHAECAAVRQRGCRRARVPCGLQCVRGMAQRTSLATSSAPLGRSPRKARNILML